MAFDPSTAKLTGFALEGANDASAQPEKKKGVSAKDYLKQLGGGATQAAGFLTRGAGDMLNELGAGVSNFYQGVTGDAAAPSVSAKDRLIGGAPLIKAGESIAKVGTNISDSISPEAKAAMEGSTPRGDITKPSTLTFGDDPSLSGYGLQAANVLGQIAPVVAAGVATRGKLLPTAGVSAGLGGGAAASQEEGRITDAPDAELAKMPAYQALIAKGMTPADARAQLAADTGASAFRSTAPISAFSALTEGLPLGAGFQGALSKVVGSSRLARAGTGALIGGAGEGVQEVVEQGAQTVGANRATGEKRSTTEDSFSQLVLGTLGGAPISAAGGFMEAPHEATAKIPGAGTAPGDVQTPQAPKSVLDGLDSPSSAAPVEQPAAAPAQSQQSSTDPAKPGAEPPAAQLTPANTAMQHPDGSVEVQPGVVVHPNDGPLSAAVATGARAGGFDTQSVITLPDGSKIDASTGEILQAAPRAVDENGQALDEQKDAPPPKLEPGELDQIVMERLAQNPFMDARSSSQLARYLGVSLSDVSNAKKRVRKELANEKQALADAGITGAEADKAALGPDGETDQSANTKPTESSDEGQKAITNESGQAPVDVAGNAQSNVGGSEEADAGNAARSGTGSDATVANGEAGFGRGQATSSEVVGQEGDGTPTNDRTVESLGKALKKTDRSTGPDGATYMVKQNANGEGYHVTRAVDGSSTQHRSKNPAQPWTREQAVQAAQELAAPKESTNAAPEKTTQIPAVDAAPAAVRGEPKGAENLAGDQAGKQTPVSDQGVDSGNAGNPQAGVSGGRVGGLRADSDGSVDAGNPVAVTVTGKPGKRVIDVPDSEIGKVTYSEGADEGVFVARAPDGSVAGSFKVSADGKISRVQATSKAVKQAITKDATRIAESIPKVRSLAERDGGGFEATIKGENGVTLGRGRTRQAAIADAESQQTKNGTPAAKPKPTRVTEANGYKVGDRVTVSQDANQGTTRSTEPYEATITDIEINAAPAYGGTAIKTARDDATPDGRGTGWTGVDKVSKVEPKTEAKPVTVSKAGEGATAIVIDPSALSAKAEPAPTSPKVQASKNTIFTEERANKARELLKKKFGQLNSGVDPELMAAGIELAGYHIEKGARTFAAYAKAMIEDLGDFVKPYLAGWYEAVRRYPGMENVDQMTPTVEVDAAQAAGFDAIEQTAKPEGDTNGPVQPAVDEGGSPQPLEAAPSADVRAPAEQGGTGSLFESGSEANAGSDGRADRKGKAKAGRSVAGDQTRVDRAGSEEVQPIDEAVHDAIANREISVQQPAGSHPRNFVIPDAMALGQGGAKTKAANNLEAIRTLKRIEQEKRAATPEEQAVLAGYVGWGGIPQAFEHPTRGITKGWERVVESVKKAMTPEELDAATRSTQDAHYTSRTVVGGIYDALARLGYTGGMTLEPSVGTGNFIGLAPESVRGSQRWRAIELDSITGRIAQQLYPESQIIAGRGFQDVNLPENHFDAVIGNPPFGTTKLFDANHKDLKGFSIHNFFFAKSLKSLKPGGVLSMVVSSSMLDKAGGKQREWLANHARLLGAIRLPNDAFKANAGTEVTTDIVFLQKLYPGETADRSWTEIGSVPDPAGGEAIPLNQYFVKNPDMLLGTMTREGKMRRANEPTLSPIAGAKLDEQLRAAVEKLPQNVMQESVLAEPDSKPNAGTGENVEPFGHYVGKDGLIHQRLPDILDERQGRALDLGAKDVERMTAMIDLRDQLKTLMRAEMNDAASGAIEGMRGTLNKAYDAFQKKFGYVNAPYNVNLFREDPDAYRLRAIERNYQKLDATDAADRGIKLPKGKVTAEVAEKAHILERRVFHKDPVQKAETAADAMAISLNTYGRLNIQRMAELLGMKQEQVVAELGDKVFMDPDDGYVTADMYLSGNVKGKLAAAKAAAQADPRMERNVRALEAVQPADISPADIFVSVGSPWVPGSDYAAFAKEVIGITDYQAKLNPILQTFETRGVSPGTERFGTGRFTARKVLDRAINRQDASVFNTDMDGKRTLDVEATEAMRAAIDTIREEFSDWVWKDQARRERLAKTYNDTYNTDRKRVYDGSFMTLPGKVDDSVIALYPSQMNAVWRMIQDGKMLADHVVGAGKTFTAIAAVMQMKRMGLAKKSMIAVPNHLVQQWASDFMKLYPNANILAVTKADFTKDRRKLLFSRIATGDWDAVIVAHSQFTRISPPKDFEQTYQEQKIEEFETAIAALKAEGGDQRSIKQIRQQQDQIKEKLKAMLARITRDDDTVAFDELGIDNLVVDEAHEFKNLGFATKKRNVSGMGSAANGGSQRAEDLFIKSRYLNSINRGRGLYFLTGTPVSNSLAEMFTMQRYLSYDDMKARGVHLFDLWANTFAQESTSFELDSSGRGLKAKTVLSKFLNVPEMMQLYTRFADTVTLEDLKRTTIERGGVWPVPKIKGGRAQNTVVKGGAPLMAYIENDIIPRMEAVSGERGPKPDPSEDNMLKITNDARLAALDVRLRDPLAPDDPNSKPNTAVESVKRIYDAWNGQKGAQLIFCDLSTPKAAVAKQRAEFEELVRQASEGDEDAMAKLDAMSPDEQLALGSAFSVYDDVRAKLVAAGIPAREIAFIHEANTDLQKKALFDKVNRGDVRVLMGSTSKMGAGTNVQERLVALHHLDAPWRPSDLEQREGRIIRQGNALYKADPEGFEVEIHRYATERTYDARMWQLIERKAGIVEQIRKGDPTMREVEDVVGESANAAEMKAAATGNPLIIEQVELAAKVKRLQSLKKSYDSRRYEAEGEVARAEANGGPDGELARELERADAGEAFLAANPRDPFSLTIGEKTFDEHKAGANAMAIKVVETLKDFDRNVGQKDVEIGQFRGATLTLRRGFANIREIEITTPELGKLGFAVDLVSREGDVTGSGILTKINNVISRIEEWRENAEHAYKRSKKRLAEFKDLLAQPFKQGAELAESAERLRAVTAQLIADSKKKGPEIKVAQEDGGTVDFDLGEQDFDLAGYAPSLSTPLSRAIHVAIERLAGPLRNAGIDVRVVENASQLPDFIRKAAGPYQPRGVVIRSKDGKSAIVFINAKGVGTITQAKRTMLHEVVGHWGMEKLLGDRFDKVAADALRLVRTDPKLAAIYERVQRYKDKGERTMAKEALAMMAEADVKNGVMARVYAAIRAFARAIGFGDVHLSHDEIRALARQAARGLTSETRAKATNRSESSFSLDFDLGEHESIADLSPRVVTEAIANASKWRVTDIAQSAIDKLADWKGELLGSLTLHQLAEIAAPYLPQVAKYDTLVRQMGARRNELLAVSDPIAKTWQKFQKKNREASKLMVDVMHDATLAGVDPAEAFKPGMVHLASGEIVPVNQTAVDQTVAELERRVKTLTGKPAELLRTDIGRLRSALDGEAARVAAHPSLKARFDALPADAKAIYVEVREAYKTRADDMMAALIKRIVGLEIGEPEKKALTSRVRAYFESARVEAPYFPLARFGNYWVSATKGDETVFKMMESQAQQKRVRKAFTDQGYTVKAGMKIDMARALDGASGSFMADVVETMNRGGVDKETTDEIYQLYLRTLPDLSVRKNFIHRKGTPGYDSDALRAFAGQMFHGAHQLARLEHAQDLEHSLRKITDDASAMTDSEDPELSNAAGRMVNEMKKRHEWVMNPKDAGWVQKVSSANFAFYLGATPAAALVNMTQTYVMTYPALAAKFGWVKAFAELNRAMGQTISTYGNVDKKLTGNELLAMKELDRLGARDKTLTHDLAGLSGADTAAYNPGWAKTMEVISHLFHKAEVFNREASGLAAYRMAVAAGQTHAEAIRFAADTIFQTHGDYQNANRARWMQGNVAKVIFAFKQYSQMMTYNLWRNFHQTMKGATPELKREAAKKLMGTLGVTALLSGIMGMPLLSVAFAMANAMASLFGDDDEPWDAETEFHNFLVEHLGEGFGRVAAYGPTQAITGLAISDRTKLNDMWFRDPNRELEGRALADYWLEQIGGPVAGMALINPLTAAKLWDEGNTERAVETIMPKALRDAMKLIRYSTQGVNNLEGEPVVRDLSPYETLMQGAGFSPARVAEQYEINNSLKNYEKAIDTRRKSLLDGYAMAMSLRDGEAVAAAFVKIQAFNRKYPEWPINSSTIRRSLQSRQGYADRMVNGIVLNKKIEGAVRDRVTYGVTDGEEDSGED